MSTGTALENIETKSAGNAIAVVEKGHLPTKPKPMSLREIQQWGDVFHQSGMFQDVKTAAAAMVKIKAGEELGFGPFASMAGIDIIQGKVSIGSGLQASLIKDSPRYRYSVKVLSDEVCTLTFYEKLDSGWTVLGESSFGKADAKNAGLDSGTNYKKYARNMYFARALTNGMRWFTPDLLRACGGQSETHDDFDVDETIAETQTDTIIVNGDVVDNETGEVISEQSVVSGQQSVAEPETREPSETETVVTLKAINELLKVKCGDGEMVDEDRAKAFLKGRDPSVMPPAALRKLLDELRDS